MPPNEPIERTSGRTQAPQGLWAITSYFNPINYRRRRANYRLFRRYFQLPLIAVELSFGGDFELGDGDAEILVQLRGGDALWQKERLLNLALRSLPSDCTAVAWVDCDVIFERSDWVGEVMRKLERVSLLQPFAEKHNLTPDWKAGDSMLASARVLHPPAVFVAKGVSAAACFPTAPLDINLASGVAWVGHREFLETHGFYDACIIGGGDNAFAAAVYGCGEAAEAQQAMNERRSDHYRRWAGPAWDAAQGRVDFIEGRVFHLWHGSVADRAYEKRHREFARFHLDPFEDIALAASGAWKWSSAKPAMHAFVREYLVSRREDG